MINLHGHSVYSISDAVASPKKIIDTCIQKGMKRIAITDHGNMCNVADFYLYSQKLKKEGKDFDPIFGCEFYYIDSVKEWQKNFESKGAKKKDSNDNKELYENEEDKDSKDETKKRYHMVLLAQDEEGLKNLYRLLYYSGKDNYFYYKPRIDFELLKEHSKGLIMLTACIAGRFANEVLSGSPKQAEHNMLNLLDKFSGIFENNRIFLELQFNKLDKQRNVNKGLLNLSRKTGIKTVATTDYHYADVSDWTLRQNIKLISLYSRTKKLDDMKVLNDINKLDYLLYIKNEREMIEDFWKLDGADYITPEELLESVNNTELVSSMIKTNLNIDTSPKVNTTFIKSSKEPYEILRELVIKGLKEKGLINNQEYLQRAKTELEVIKKKNFVNYFLIYDDIVKTLQDYVMISPGRGSGAGCLINYLLGITQVDPIKHNLLFERFLNEYREDFPDIDTDISDRDIAIKVLKRKYGEDNVLPISTYSTFQIKNAIKHIAKINNVSFEEINEITKLIDDELEEARSEQDIDKQGWAPNWEFSYENSKTLKELVEKYPVFKSDVPPLLEGLSHIGTHAGGLCIAENLKDEMPLIFSKGRPQASFTEGVVNKNLGSMGFIKFDILGVKTIEAVRYCIHNILHFDYKFHGKEKFLKEYEEIIKQDSGDIFKYDAPEFIYIYGEDEDKIKLELKFVKEFYNQYLHPDVIDLNDKAVLNFVFEAKNYLGMFQFQTHGMKSTTERVGVHSFEDICAMSAMYRPGPLRAGVTDFYSKNKEAHFNGNLKHEHPILEDVLKNTYGLMIYQEQIMKVGEKLGLLNGKDVQKLRKIFLKKTKGKDGKDEEQERIWKEFLEGCIKNNLTEEKATEVFEKIKYFSGYGFCMAHALSYSLLTYQCAYLFYYFRNCWSMSILSLAKNEDDKKKYIDECMNCDINILGPDIEKSKMYWSFDEHEKSIRFGLADIKGIGEKEAANIVGRQYNNINELFDLKVNNRKLNKKVKENLFKSGALDNLIKKSLLTKQNVYNILTDNFKGNHNQTDLFESSIKETEYTLDMEIEDLRETLSFVPNFYIDEEALSFLKQNKVFSIDDIANGQIIHKPIWFFVNNYGSKTNKEKGTRFVWIEATGRGKKLYKIYYFNNDSKKILKLMKKLSKFIIILGKAVKYKNGMLSLKDDNVNILE